MKKKKIKKFPEYLEIEYEIGGIGIKHHKEFIKVKSINYKLEDYN